MGSDRIGSRCGVKWGAESSAVTWLSVIGGNMGSNIEGRSGVTGFGKEMGHLPLLGREIVKVYSRTGKGLSRRRSGILDRARGAVLIFIFRKLLLKPLTDVAGSGGFLEPGLNISQSFV